MTLYEIDKTLKSVIPNEDVFVDTETGEVFSADALDALQMDFDKKVENIALFIKSDKAEAEMIKAEEERLAKRRKAKESRAKWLSNYLQKILDGKTAESAKFCITYRQSKSVNVLDEKLIPDEFFVQRKPEVSKSRIATALKAGKNVPGAELIENMNIQIK